MPSIPAKVEASIKDAPQRYQPVIGQGKAMDICNADTSMLVKDVLADLFGYDKYNVIVKARQLRNVICAVWISVLVTACGEKGAIERQKTEAKVAQLEEKIAALSAESKALSETLNSAIDRASGLEARMYSKVDEVGPAILDSSSRGYSTARNEYGAFPASIEDVQPYLDGFKLTLKVGNIFTTTFRDAEIGIRYGPREPELPDLRGPASDATRKAFKVFQAGMAESEARRKTLQEKAKVTLQPGKWNTVEFIIPNAKAEELGRVEVLVHVNTMALN